MADIHTDDKIIPTARIRPVDGHDVIGNENEDPDNTLAVLRRSHIVLWSSELARPHVNAELLAAQSFWNNTVTNSTLFDLHDGWAVAVERRHSGLIAFDLDGTLAMDNGISWPEIGAPVEKMRQRLYEYTQNGYEVCVFTARGGEDEQIARVNSWLLQHFYWMPTVTNVKSYRFIKFYDDRAEHIIHNAGITDAEHRALLSDDGK